MFKHNLKIAFRNMRKYFNQTLISVIGLAVGFTCFALATLWIRYEMTFDSFHKNAGNMYVVYRQDSFSPSGESKTTNYPLAAYLKETFPEIEDAIALAPSWRESRYILDGVEFSALAITADSSLFRMFDVKIIEGGTDFLIPGNNSSIAITQEKARQLFGNENPIGKTLSNAWDQNFTICAIVSDMSKQSNYAFDFIQPFYPYVLDMSRNWFQSSGESTIIKLLPGINIEAFEKKLYEHDMGDDRRSYRNMTVRPLTKLRYTDPNVPRDMKFQHILIFSLSGLLVVLCSLFNYLTLYVSRFRIRQKELALRMVCGASGRSLLSMLSIEFIITLLFAVALGGLLTQLFHNPFLTLSAVPMSLPAIYRESLMYVGGVIVVSLFVFWTILLIFRYRSLNLSIRRSSKKTFRKASVVVQLMISIGFAFCTIVILKQMYFLRNTTELGFSFQNRGTITIRTEGLGDALTNHLKQIPEIVDAFNATRMVNLVPLQARFGQGVSIWDDMPADAETISMERMHVSPEYNAFYEFRLLMGEMLADADPDSVVLINESALKAFGWHEPIGKIFNNRFIVKGVIRNVYNFAPTVEARPSFYLINPPGSGWSSGNATTVMFKYHDGMWKQCKEKIDRMIISEFPDARNVTVYNSEEEYDKFLTSENALIKLLTVVAIICLLICVFGFVSLVSLTCEERRKSIAIRKINGATVGDILGMFAKEYFLLLFIGAAIAFPAGHLIMQRWLEQYVKQTNIAAWVYLSILFALAIAIVVCVGWQVYKSSVENPAEVVKSEN